MPERTPDLEPAATFESRLAQSTLTYQRCCACNKAVFYPRLSCPHCGAQELAWQQSGGVGTVYSLSHIPSREGTGTIVALVDLDEGFRVMANLESGDGSISIGARVLARIVTDEEPARLIFGTEALGD